MMNIKFGTGKLYLLKDNGVINQLLICHDSEIDADFIDGKELDKTIKMPISKTATFTASATISRETYLFLIHGDKVKKINNWRRMHGLPLIRRRKK